MPLTSPLLLLSVFIIVITVTLFYFAGAVGAEEDGEDADAGSEAGFEVAGDFADAADALAVADGDFLDAKIVLGSFDLHLEVPAVGELGHLCCSSDVLRMARNGPISV